MKITSDVRLLVGAVVVLLGTLAAQQEFSWRSVLVSIVAGLGTIVTERTTDDAEVEI